MSQPLFWLTLTVLATALMWMPYILNAMYVRGVITTLGNPQPDAKPLSPWADRAKKAHANAVENLAIFVALIVAAHLAKTPEPVIVGAAMVYFFARLAHFAVYTLGIPFVRTLTFLTGFGAQVIIAITILKHLSP